VHVVPAPLLAQARRLVLVLVRVGRAQVLVPVRRPAPVLVRVVQALVPVRHLAPVVLPLLVRRHPH
jgi:hypothetical protein